MWSLWTLVNASKFHAKKLRINHLWVRETCEGWINTLFFPTIRKWLKTLWRISSFVKAFSHFSLEALECLSWPISRKYFTSSHCMNRIPQIFIRSHLVILHIRSRDRIEQFLRTGYLSSFNGIQFHGRHRAFGFCNEEDVLHSVFFHGNGPVGSIVAYRCRYLERTR